MQNRKMLIEKLKNIVSSSDIGIRNDSFETGFPASFNYYDLKKNLLAEAEIIINDKPIEKLRFCVDKVAKNGAALYITWPDGSKKTISIPPDKIIEFRDTLKELGATEIITFGRMDKEALSWDELRMDTIYDENKKRMDTIYGENKKHAEKKENDPYKEYEILHNTISQAILSIMKTSAITELNIVDGGCGDGKLIKLISQSIADKNIRAHLVGFDFNEENVNLCKEHYEGPCKFIKGNLLAIDEVFKESKKLGYLDSHAPTILTLSGSLTRLVLDNGFAALTSLQKAALSDVDYLIGGGVGEPLINDYIAKRIGYKKENLNIEGKEKSKFFIYKKMGLEEIKQNKINKMNKRNILDLSLSPDPAKLLKLLNDHIKDKMVIDLSFCQLNEELITTLHSIFKDHADIKLIYWNWNKDPNDNIDKFVSEFAGKAEIISLNKVEKDAYLMAPRPFYASLHTASMFKTPNQQVLERKEDISPKNPILKKFTNFVQNFNGNVNISKPLIFQFMLESSKCSPLPLPVEIAKNIRDGLEKFIDPTTISMKLDMVFVEGKDNKKNEVIFSGIENYIEGLKNKVLAGDFSFLPQLIYIFHNGITVTTYEKKGYCMESSQGEELPKEISFYRDLSKAYPNDFPADLMYEIADKRIKDVKGLKNMDEPEDAVQFNTVLQVQEAILELQKFSTTKTEKHEMNEGKLEQTAKEAGVGLRNSK